MNKKLFLLLLFAVPLNLFYAQKNACKCTELEKYHQKNQEKWKTYTFQPVSKDSAIKPPFSFIKTDFLYDPSKRSDIVDSIEIKMAPYRYLMNISEPENNDADKKKKKDKKKKGETSYMDGFEKYMKIEDSIRGIEAAKLIGPLSKIKVIKSEQNKNKWAILYYDFKYDEMLTFAAGYWLAYSEDSGKNWSYNYTGLSEKNNYIFKENSKLPLWKDDHHLQIESDIVRMTDPMGHPLPPEYEVVRDNALVIMDINEILKDSDHDGTNDITEKKLFLNPNSADTDEDGIPDSKDTNPRFKSDTNEFTTLYEGIMYGNYEFKGKTFFEEFDIDVSNPKVTSKENLQQQIKDTEADFPQIGDVFNTVQMIVTDDKNLQQINPPNETIIILTTKEYEQYKKQNQSKIILKSITPLFKCDTEKDTYILQTSGSYSGETYKIKRTKKGWNVKIISSWIS
jgi:hypothetical protein